MDAALPDTLPEVIAGIRVAHPSDFLGVLELEAAEEHLVRRYRNLLHAIENRIPYENIDLERTAVLAHGQTGWFNWAQLFFAVFVATALVCGVVFPHTPTVTRGMLSLPPLFLSLFCIVLAFVKKPYIAFFDGMGNLLFEIANEPKNKFFYDHLRTKIEIADLTLPGMRVEEEEPLD